MAVKPPMPRGVDLAIAIEKRLHEKIGPLTIANQLAASRLGVTRLLLTTVADFAMEHDRVDVVPSRLWSSSVAQAGFLYDLTAFWLEEPNGIALRQYIVMESEYNTQRTFCRGTGDTAIIVDVDFQKLVQARADVRVWASLYANRDIADAAVETYERQIANFEGANKSDLYVLAMLEWKTKTMKTVRLPR